ncbi:MAG: hypothetical protein RLZZ28_1475 [Bacteroidota bacterium]|jgi:ElaA protein
MTGIKYTLTHKPFEAFTPFELYQVMRLRSEVFVVEQQCIYLDADNKDPLCYHLMLWDEAVLVAYARLVPEKLSYTEKSIGRIISSPKYRKTGAGRLLVKKAIELSNEIYGKGPIKIGAQAYLQKFYESFGFVQCSDHYLEDDIDHIDMLLA